MDVAIEPEAGLQVIQKFQEAVKALMGVILQIPIAGDRSVGDDDIDAPGPCDLPLQLADPRLHLRFRVLQRIAAVAAGAAKSQDPDALIDDEVVVNAGAAFRRIFQQCAVMVAVDVEERLVSHRDDVFQILRMQIADRDNEVRILEIMADAVGIEQGIFLVADAGDVVEAFAIAEPCPVFGDHPVHLPVGHFDQIAVSVHLQHRDQTVGMVFPDAFPVQFGFESFVETDDVDPLSSCPLVIFFIVQTAKQPVIVAELGELQGVEL